MKKRWLFLMGRAEPPPNPQHRQTLIDATHVDHTPMNWTSSQMGFLQMQIQVEVKQGGKPLIPTAVGLLQHMPPKSCRG